MYSKKELSQLVVAYCVAYDVEHVVISPGSRNAPLTIGFTSHPKIKTYSIVDERCAAFFALGIAQQTRKPTAIICTSGSALLNYYPAIAEAFYSDIPLIVISADRPKHLIDIGDGQAIRQENVFKNHSLYNANLVEGKEHRSLNSELISDAIQNAIDKKGPVHINVPFDEPLYETTTLTIEHDRLVDNNIQHEESLHNFEYFGEKWNACSKKIVLIGANYPNQKLQEQLIELAKDDSVLIFTESTSNVFDDKFINSIDKLIAPLDEAEFLDLKPEILLSLGGMVISKKVKQFFRKYQPKYHLHVDKKNAPSTFHCLKYHFDITPTVFFDGFLQHTKPVISSYQKRWLSVKKDRDTNHIQFIKEVEFSDLKVVDVLLKNIPNHAQLQLANSSIVRYTQLFDNNPTLKIFCNRGTSGIDGSTSTAIGAAHAVKNQTVFITGDISFFYDSNALWNKYVKNDFRIILINNGGGGIFKILPEPSKTNALDYFETPHHLTAKHLCEMYQFQYVKAANEKELIEQLNVFFDKGETPKLLEIFTPNEINDKVLKSYFQNL